MHNTLNIEADVLQQQETTLDTFEATKSTCSLKLNSLFDQTVQIIFDSQMTTCLNMCTNEMFLIKCSVSVYVQYIVHLSSFLCIALTCKWVLKMNKYFKANIIKNPFCLFSYQEFPPAS